jgi:ketosteroid isomerase-like protein
MSTREAVESFIRAINSGNPEAISACMAEDHVFIDSLGNRVAGRQAMTAGWRAYLGMFPDYHIRVEGLMADGNDALLWGSAEGTFHRAGAPATDGKVMLHAAWRAVIATDKIRLWQVFADNKPVYELLARS